MGALCCCCKSFLSSGDSVPIIQPPKVIFDDRHKGAQVSLSGRQQTISGTGVALASTRLEQDRAYFEFKVNKTGSFQVGVANRRVNLDGELGDDSTLSWGFQSHAQIKDGDVIGVSYDQADLPCANFFHNGQLLDNERLTGMRGELYPAAAVRNGAKLTANFGHQFEYEPPAQFKYSGIIPASSLIG